MAEIQRPFLVMVGWSKEYKREYMRKYRLKRYHEDPEFRAKALERARNNKRKAKFGIGNAEVAELLDGQDGVCMICMSPLVLYAATERHKAAHVDHDHKSGQIRGILCNNCNNGLGRFKDDPDLLRAAVWYLTRLPLEPEASQA